MKHTQKMKRLLECMAILNTWSGKLCQMPEEILQPGGLAQRTDEVHVPVQEVPEIQKAIAGYQLFCNLAEQYAEEVVRMSRREQENKKRGKQERNDKS